MNMRTAIFLMAVTFIFTGYASAFPGGDDIAKLQRELNPLSIGERIARWAETFVDTPYDPDPFGAYVTRKAIVADDQVDCMYHTFRSVELALTNTPEEAFELALSKRFLTLGRIVNGTVVNYDERYQYAMDMLESGKWGTDVTSRLGPVRTAPGARHHGEVTYIHKDEAEKALSSLRSGDIIFFIKDPSRRVVGEIVGHIGIIRQEHGTIYLIHASGRKNHGGLVKKVPFQSYIKDMPFAGFKVSRF